MGVLDSLLGLLRNTSISVGQRSLHLDASGYHTELNLLSAGIAILAIYLGTRVITVLNGLRVWIL